MRTATEQVLTNPRSIKARRELAAHWSTIGDPRAELTEQQLAEYDGLGAEVWEVLASIGLEPLNPAKEAASMSYHPMDIEGWPPLPKEFLYVD